MSKVDSRKEDKPNTPTLESSSNKSTLSLSQRIKQYIIINKHWIFSGIGVEILAIVVAVIGYFLLRHDGTHIVQTISLLIFLGFIIALTPFIIVILYAIKQKVWPSHMRVHHESARMEHSVSNIDLGLHRTDAEHRKSNNLIVDFSGIFGLLLVIIGLLGVIFLFYKFTSTMLTILGLLFLASGSTETQKARTRDRRRKKNSLRKTTKKKKAKKKKSKKKKTKRVSRPFK